MRGWPRTEEKQRKPLNRQEKTKVISDQIEALKIQRTRIERLLIIFRRRATILDAWSQFLFELLRARSEVDPRLISLPDREKEFLRTVVGQEDAELRVNEAVSRLLKGSEVPTIAKLDEILKSIDETILELTVCLRMFEEDDRSAIDKAKALVARRVGPICLGVTLIVLDSAQMNWATIIGGSALVLKGVE